MNKNIGINFFPLYDYEKSVIGYVGVGFYLEEVNRIYYESLYKFVIFSICFSAIIFAILFLIVSKLFKPFGEIIEGIKILEKGEYNKKIVIKSYGELRLLSESINSLSEAVEIREKQLKKQNEELLELDKMKDYFLANTSHELKTPLNGIMGIAESLVITDSERFSKDTIKKISMIVLSAKRLGNLVNDILDFSKMRNKKLVLT